MGRDHNVLRFPNDVFPLPILSSGETLLFNWTGFRPTNEFAAFLAMDRATDTDSFVDAANKLHVGNFNWVTADADGIGYRSPARVPVRTWDLSKYPPWQILPGDAQETFWKGDSFLRGDALPQSDGGAQGYIVAANNDPFGFTIDGRVENDAAYYGAFFMPGYRAARAESEIDRVLSDRKITTDDLKALQLDTWSGLADALVPRLRAAWESASNATKDGLPANQADMDTVVTLLAEWDLRMQGTGAAPTAFMAFSFFALDEALADDLPILLDALVSTEAALGLKFVDMGTRDDSPLAEALFEGGASGVLLRALARTATYMTATFGGIDNADAAFDSVSHSVFPNRLGDGWDEEPVHAPGFNDTINYAAPAFLSERDNPDGSVLSTRAAVYRMVVEFGENGPSRPLLNFTGGPAEAPESTAFAAGTPDWAAGTYHEVPLSEADIESASTDSIVLD